jgi:putative ABC transport system permease protein
MSRRRTEIAVRMAVGARRAEVVGLVLSQGLRLAILGLLVGLVGAAVVGRVLRSALPDVRPLDIGTLGSVAIVLTLAAAAASIVPAVTSGRTAPSVVLREDL